MSIFLVSCSFATGIERSKEYLHRYKGLVQEFRCVVCENQSLLDSAAPLAEDLRARINDMMQAGYSNEQITMYLVNRYGDFISYKPPFDYQTWLLWLGPILLLFFIIGSYLRLINSNR
jgi:cytochrome c-type biogenesis protein CcmH